LFNFSTPPFVTSVAAEIGQTGNDSSDRINDTSEYNAQEYTVTASQSSAGSRFTSSQSAIIPPRQDGDDEGRALREETEEEMQTKTTATATVTAVYIDYEYADNEYVDDFVDDYINDDMIESDSNEADSENDADPALDDDQSTLIGYEPGFDYEATNDSDSLEYNGNCSLCPSLVHFKQSVKIFT
jgi:hypothetical protein